MCAAMQYERDRAVAWVNDHPEVHWRWWRYSIENGLFFLRGSVYGESEETVGFMVFRRLRYFRMSDAIGNAQCMVGPEKLTCALPPGLDLKGAEVVALQGPAEEFCFVCESFYFVRGGS